MGGVVSLYKPVYTEPLLAALSGDAAAECSSSAGQLHITKYLTGS